MQIEADTANPSAPGEEASGEAAFSPSALAGLARQTVSALRAAGARLAGAESCTGGLIAQVITVIPGASDCFEGTVVSYSNRVKQTLLRVPGRGLRQNGAVSEQTVVSMLHGVRRRFHSDYGYAVSGIAGPGGGTPTLPVGTVVVGLYAAGKGRRPWEWVHRFRFSGDREAVRLAAAHTLLSALCKRLAEDSAT